MLAHVSLGSGEQFEGIGCREEVNSFPFRAFTPSEYKIRESLPNSGLHVILVPRCLP